jgi:hypothetical protein
MHKINNYLVLVDPRGFDPQGNPTYIIRCWKYSPNYKMEEQEVHGDEFDYCGDSIIYTGYLSSEGIARKVVEQIV